MAKDTVVDGKILVAEETLKEGAQVTVLALDPPAERDFALDTKDEAALLELIREADAGELIDSDEVLRELGCRV